MGWYATRGAAVAAAVGLGVTRSGQVWLVPISSHVWRLAKFRPPRIRVARCGVFDLFLQVWIKRWVMYFWWYSSSIDSQFLG